MQLAGAQGERGEGKRRRDGAAGAAGSNKRLPLIVLDGGGANMRLAALWRQEKSCDVKVRVGEEVFKGHRVVLAAESMFFANLFGGQFGDSKKTIVDIHEMEPRVFSLALDFMYDGKCAVDSSALEEVLSAASVLQIDSLLATVETELKKHVTADNCASIMVCADRHHLPQLMLTAETIAREAFVDVASDPAVPAPNMLALLKSDSLNVKNEQDVFETLAKWLKGQEESVSEDEQMKMFELVRFTLLSQDFIDSTVMTEPAFSTLRANKLLLAQFKDAFFGETPKQRSSVISQNL